MTRALEEKRGIFSEENLFLCEGLDNLFSEYNPRLATFYHDQSCPMVSSAPANHPEQFVIEKCLLPEAVWVRGRGVNLSKYFLSQSLTSINPFKEATGLHLSHTEDHQGIGQKEEDKDSSFITALIYKTPKLCNRIDQLKLSVTQNFILPMNCFSWPTNCVETIKKLLDI